MSRYVTPGFRSDGAGKMVPYPKDDSLNVFAVARDGLIVVFLLFVVMMFWPLRTVPTGTRGVITVGGSIKGVESEGFMLVWPWQRLDIFNIRAEEATIENAEGATSDTQPVKVNLTVRYSIATDKVAEVFEKFSHTGDLSSYI